METITTKNQFRKKKHFLKQIVISDIDSDIDMPDDLSECFAKAFATAFTGDDNVSPTIDAHQVLTQAGMLELIGPGVHKLLQNFDTRRSMNFDGISPTLL